MAKRKTGSKQGQEACKVLFAWRDYGVPDHITEYEAYHLTGGIIGKPASAKEMRLIEVAMKYVKRGGSLNDYDKLKEGAK